VFDIDTRTVTTAMVTPDQRNFTGTTVWPILNID